MKHIKTFSFIMVMCLVCLSFSGCAVEEFISGVMDEHAAEKSLKVSKALQSSIAGYKTNDVTKKASDKVAKTSEKLASATQKLADTPKGFWDNIPLLGAHLPTAHNRAAKARSEALAAANKAQENLKSAISSDKILAKDKADKNKDKFNLGSILGVAGKVLLAAILLFVVLFVFSLILNKRKKSKPAPTEEPEASEKKDWGPDYNPDLLAVDYDALLKENCKKVKVTYQEVLDMFNGDAHFASDAVQQCTAKGIVGDEAMEFIKVRAEHFRSYGN